MKSFNFIREFINYIPQCIVCGKDMLITINGTPNIESYYSKHTEISIKTCISNNYLLVSKNNKYQLIINVDNNNIDVGKKLILSLIHKFYNISLNKSCSTCKFFIKSVFNTNMLSNYSVKNLIFPITFLSREELCYTKNHGKNIRIVKYYINNLIWNNSYPAHNVYMSIDNKSIKYPNLDFSKFKDLKHFNKRLSTILTFQ